MAALGGADQRGGAMKSFDERDVRRHYDLLQHKPELGLTQLKALDGENIIGIGLFDNEDDFVSECRRYNELGSLYVGVNPRSVRLLEEYGGLKNRMRTLFIDVVEEGDVDYVTGVAVAGTEGLSESAQKYRRDASVLADGEVYFPMDEPIPVPEDDMQAVRDKIARWVYGKADTESVSLMQFVMVAGAARQGRRWFRRRVQFQHYRPYILDGIASEIVGKSAEDGGEGDRRSPKV
jgi:hypothetical protein